MEFRAPAAAREEYERVKKYLTNELDDPDSGVEVLDGLVEELGHCVYQLPQWHPLFRRANPERKKHISSIHGLEAYSGADHTVYFVRGFVTCPYSEADADRLVASVKEISGLHAYRLNNPLYMDNAFPVVVESYDVDLEADGTIDSRTALIWFVDWITEDAKNAEVAETWWNIRSYILGSPHGSRSSLAVNQYAGRQMRRILETLNESGLFGPILEVSLDMLGNTKKRRLAETLMGAAMRSWDDGADPFDFYLRDELCVASVRDTFDDKTEYSINVKVGDGDVRVSGFYYPEQEIFQFLEPTGKRRIAEKFV